MAQVLAILTTPPPIHGSNIMNQMVKDDLIKSGLSYKVIDYNFVSDIKSIGKFSFRKIIHFVRIVFEILRTGLKTTYDVAYFPIVTSPGVFWRDAIVVLLLKHLRVNKVILHIHGSGIKEITKKFPNITNHVFQKTELIVLTREMKEDYSFIDIKKHIIPNGIPDKIGTYLPKKSDTLTLTFIGNFFKSKGVLTFIDIVKLIRSSTPELEFYIIGQGTDELSLHDIEEYVESNGLTDALQYIGPLYGEAKFDVLRKTKFLIFPTFYKRESFGLVLIEAFMTSTPVISTVHNGIPSVVRNGVDGYLFESTHDLDRVASEILRIYADDYQSYTRQARLSFEKNYSDNLFKNRIRKILCAE